MPDWFPYPIRYVGDCGISSRGYSMRGNLAALHEVGIRRDQIDIMPWPATMSLQEDWFFDRFLRSRDDRPDFDQDARRVNIVDVRLPDVRGLWTKNWYNVAIAAWPTNRLPDEVADALRRFDEIWAVSDHVELLLRQAGVQTPVYVIPTPLQPELLKTPPKHVAPDIAPEVHPYIGPHEFKHTSPVCFYYIGRWNTRKNVDGLLKAYFATGWTNRDPVELIIHSRDAVSEVCDRGKDAPIVRLLTTPKTHSWVCKLHQMNHVFVTATRGDSFSLPAWEAAAVGNLVVVPEDGLEPPQGTLFCASNLTTGRGGADAWWEPDLDDLTEQFKVAFDLIRSGWLGTDWAEATRKQVSPAAVGELLKARLTAIGAKLKE